jgi:hypothetical protein
MKGLPEMPASCEPNKHDGPIELEFDISKASAQVKFLGLLDGPTGSDKELTGLFDWICQECRTVNQDTVTLKPQRLFLAKWSCSGCSQTTLVRFHARAAAEWIAQHTLAVTGKTFDELARDDDEPLGHIKSRPRPQNAGQRLFAWVAVPSLCVIILMAVRDVRRIPASSATPQKIEHGLSQSTPSSRIVGYWINESADHVLYFGPIDRVLYIGTYTVVSRGSKRVDTVQFQVIHEEITGEQLVIREEPGEYGKERAKRRMEARNRQMEIIGPSGPVERAEVTLRVSKDGRTMTRVEMWEDEAVITLYHRAGEALTQFTPPHEK